MDANLDRTRLPWVEQISAAFPVHGFTAFHRGALQDAIARNGHLVAQDLRDAPTLAFRAEDGATFSWVGGPDGLRIVDGDAEAATLVEITEQGFSDYINELITATGATWTGRARVVRGTLKGWKRWEPAIRSLSDGRQIYGPWVGDQLVDRAGRPLELGRSFAADEPLEAMGEFFATMGYLHVRGVFSPEEIDRFGAEIERCCARSTPGDPHSWWSTNTAGEELVTRINHCERFSPVLLDLAHDPRLARFARLAGRNLRVCDDRLDGPMAFIKHANIVKGKGDLVWHVDDGIGGYPVMCPLIQAGVQLDPANAANGQVLLLAGSHRYNKHAIEWGEESGLPVVALETRPGDLTLHYGDTMHGTPPPTSDDAGRRVLYYKFAEPKTFAWIPPHCHYNDVLFQVDASGQVAARGETWDSATY
jgi:hypothetical protein